MPKANRAQGKQRGSAIASAWIILLLALLPAWSPNANTQSRRTKEAAKPDKSKRLTTLTPRRIAERAFPSIVLLVMEDRNGHPSSLGSGFVVGPGIVATNLHVVEGTAKGYAKQIGLNTRHEIAGTAGIDELRDLVLLSVPTLSAPSLPLADPNEVAVGDDVFAVGNPRGFEGTFSRGIVSGIRKVGTDLLLQVTAAISPGSSGGPVLNNKGEVVGVAALTFAGGQNLNFAIPVAYVARLTNTTQAVSRLWSGTRSKGLSLLREFETGLTEGVSAESFSWEESPLGNPYSFTLRNRLRVPVTNVRYLIVFFDVFGHPLHTVERLREETIHPGLARRVEDGGYDIPASVRRMTTRYNTSTGWENRPHTKLEIRILYFDMEE